MSEGKPPKPDGEAVPTPAARLVKRAPATPPKPTDPRDKACAKCGGTFTVLPGEKFFLCPSCYRRSFQSKRGKLETKVLTQITCVACGAREYLPFLPEDPAKALCQTCFRARKAEPQAD
jgi:NMD protein affecting ribosome stability and mRNA decay